MRIERLTKASNVLAQPPGGEGKVMNRDTHSSPTMDISALVNNDEGVVLPRRSISNSISQSAPSPVTLSPKHPPASGTHMSLKRKRHDPKPIWAYLEGEQLPPELQQLEEQQRQQRQQARPPPPTAQPHPPTGQRNGPPAHAPGAPSAAVTELSGFERPISGDAHVYDDVSRKVCDFIWATAVNSDIVRKAIAESPQTQLEVEARWGQILDKHTSTRLRGFHDTECVLRRNDNLDVKFESTMTMEQHKRMNMYLNGQVQSAKASRAKRAEVGYQHTREIDMFYEMGQEAFDQLPPAVRVIIAQSGTRQRIRVTKDAKTGNVIRKIVKHRLANLEISSPQTEWDYRIGVNLEIEYPGSIDGLALVVEQGKTPESMQRQKDRMSYAWMGAYQVDLTQVVQGSSKNHELELELTSDVLLDNADKAKRKEPSQYESLINGMMNNLRVLSRVITTPP
jgi:polynucleotide 5'-triphosphatase